VELKKSDLDDADGALLGGYRKTHIPNALGYQEKQYFNPGDTGSRCGTPGSDVWGSAFAGTSGSRKPLGAWR